MLDFVNTYAALPDRFYARVHPSGAPSPRLIAYNRDLARELGPSWEAVDDATAAAVFSGNQVPDGSMPIAMAYAGHQFGGFSPQLGDGRAILLGETVDRDGVRRDIQLKGAGRTPYSRGGDGRAALGPVIREYIVSEAMHALGLPTTRALAAVATGDQVYRETVLPGAVLTRVAKSHVRVGTFQFFAARGDTDGVKALADYVIARLYPDLANEANPYLGLLRRVAERQSALVARWMQIGFIHGVMNTDNSSISGETIDFGPCAFMEAYDPATVFSSIDRNGRYAYHNQAGIAQWNLARLAETLLPLLADELDAAVEIANAEVQRFGPLFTGHWVTGLRRKLGLARERDGDEALIQGFLDLLQAGEVDFTRGFRLLADAAEGNDGPLLSLFVDHAPVMAWLDEWRRRHEGEEIAAAERAVAMRAVNPVYIPRNHLIEEAIVAATEREDYGPFERLHAVLAHPYDQRADVAARYELPAEPEERVLRTFCGT
jgi:uncharacterized protein YdiU (UPF0061 family)